MRSNRVSAAAAVLVSLLATDHAWAAEADWCSVPVASISRDLVAEAAARITPKLAGADVAIAHLHSSHTLPGAPGLKETQAAIHRLEVARDAALIWRAGGGDAFGALATRALVAWTDAYQPDFNPIDETKLDALIQVDAIMGPSLDAPARGKAAAMLRGWAAGYVERMRAAVRYSSGDTWRNNWQSNRVKLVTMVAVALRDSSLFDDARELFKRQLAKNILADGMVVDFQMRDAIHYVVTDLEPLLQAALAARSWGEDWYHLQSPVGASVADAVHWAAPYADGRLPHNEFVHSKVPFDAERARAGVRGFSGPFDPRQAGTMFWLAAQFEPDYAPLARRLSPAEPLFLALCGQ